MRLAVRPEHTTDIGSSRRASYPPPLAGPFGGHIDPLLGILGIALIIATATDIQSKRVPNLLTGPLILVGIAAQWYFGDGVPYALYSVVLTFVLHFLLYVIKLEGAGDAKLMMGVAALIGWEEMLEASIWRYVILLPYGVVVLTVQKRWDNFKAAALWTFQKFQGLDVGERPEPTYMPFAPLIMIGTIAALSTDWLDISEYTDLPEYLGLF